MGSDHRPMLTTISQQGKVYQHQQRARWNFNWAAYKLATEEKFSKIICNNQMSVNDLEKQFTSIIVSSSKKHIPRGINKKYKPFWNPDIQSAVTTQQQARENFGRILQLKTKYSTVEPQLKPNVLL